MNRDDQDAARENMTGLEAAQAVAQTLPAPSLSGANSYVLDVQAAVNKAVSAATRNLRQWTRQTLYAAYKAARPIVISDLRQQGKAFTASEVKAAVRPRVAAYVSQYGVSLPAGTRVGSTPLEAVAGDVCGAFSLPWTSFMPPQIQAVAKAAQSGSPKAQGWLKKLFAGKGQAPAAPTPAPVPAAAPATAVAAKAAKSESDEAGKDVFAGWTLPSLSSVYRRDGRGYGGRGRDDRGGYNRGGRSEGHRRHRHHRRRGQGQGQGQYATQQTTLASPSYNPALPISANNQPYNPALPISATNQPPYTQQPYGQQPYGLPYNPATSAAQSAFDAAHAGVTSPVATPYNPYLSQPYNPALPISAYNQPTAYNPALPVSAYNQPQQYNPALPVSATNVPPATQDYLIEGDMGSGDSLGAYLHKLNPLYWLKSPEERKLIDIQKQAWIDNADLQKKTEKRGEVLDSAKKALEAKQAVAAAQARSAELEAQLKAIESQVTGACMGKAEIVGMESSTLGSIGPAEIVGADHKPNPYNEKEDPFGDQIPDEDGKPIVGKIKKARQLNQDNQEELAPLCAKLQANKPLSPAESAKVMILLARNEQLHEFRKGIVSGELYAKSPSAKKIQRSVVMGAVAAMTPTEQQMLAKITALAKQDNPNAVKALSALKAQGYAVTMGQAGPAAKIVGVPMTPAEQQQLAAIVAMAKKGNAGALKAIASLNEHGHNIMLGSAVMGSDMMGTDTYVGWGISDAFSLALKPVTWTASTLWKGTKAIGRGLGITHGSASPEQVRLARLKAARNRQRAAQARARMADAQSEAEYRAQQAFSQAADAEADAADAEATAKEAAMQTAESEFLPGQTDTEAAAANAVSSSGMGRTAPVITQLPDTPAPPTPTAVKLKAQRRALIAKKNPRAAKILAKSEESSPAGMKLAASMELYKRAEKRKSKERKAVAMMVAKAKKGDKQALADVQALKAAGIAVKAERSAGRKVAVVYAYRATTAKVIAARKKAEVAMSDKLIRRSRAKQLAKVAKIERKSAAGDPKARAFVKNQVAKAKAGDPNAQKVTSALLLAKSARTVAPNKREQKKLRAAGKMTNRIAKGNKKAIRDSRIIVAAAKHGNPNAKKAREKLRVAAAYEQTLRTGAIVVPGAVVATAAMKKKQKAKKAADQRKLASVEDKIKKGTASREEAQAAAVIAANEGDKAKSAELMTSAATLPSAGEELRRVATVAAAAQAGNPRYQSSIDNASQLAAQGDPRGIEAVGKLAGVKALNDVSAGKPIDPEMKRAAQDLEKAQAGDVVATEKLAAMQTQAAEKVPAAVKYMVAATGAAVVARALADNPKAHDEWLEKVGAKPRTDTENEPVVVDAEIVTPGMSSLPDAPLPPIQTVWGLLKASLAAIAMATKDPFQNYKEGVTARSKNINTISGADSDPKPTRDAADWMARRQHAQTAKDPEERYAVHTPKDPDEQYRVHGEDVKLYRSLDADQATTAARAKLVSDTKARLTTLVKAATTGDKKAQAKWETAKANYGKAKARAAKGDKNAADVVSVLEATGLFAK